MIKLALDVGKYRYCIRDETGLCRDMRLIVQCRETKAAVIASDEVSARDARD